MTHIQSCSPNLSILRRVPGRSTGRALPACASVSTLAAAKRATERCDFRWSLLRRSRAGPAPAPSSTLCRACCIGLRGGSHGACWWCFVECTARRGEGFGGRCARGRGGLAAAVTHGCTYQEVRAERRYLDLFEIVKIIHPSITMKTRCKCGVEIPGRTGLRVMDHIISLPTVR